MRDCQAREVADFRSDQSLSAFGQGGECAAAALGFALRSRRNGKFGQNNATGLLPSRLGLVT